MAEIRSKRWMPNLKPNEPCWLANGPGYSSVTCKPDWSTEGATSNGFMKQLLVQQLSLLSGARCFMITHLDQSLKIAHSARTAQRLAATAGAIYRV